MKSYMIRHLLCLLCCADVIQPAEADCVVEKYDPERMAKKDHESECALWNNRLFAAQQLGDWYL